MLWKRFFNNKAFHFYNTNRLNEALPLFRGALESRRERYGDPFTLKALNGTAVVTGSPTFVHQIFAARPEHYDPFAVDVLRGLVGEHMLLGLTGEAHKRERKLLTPPFHGARMRAYGRLMAEVAVRHAELVDKKFTQNLSDSEASIWSESRCRTGR